MANTVQAAAEGLPTDTMIAEAMKEMENSIRELSHMAHIVTNELQRMLFVGTGPRQGTSKPCELEYDEIDRVMFAAYNVHKRCKALEARYEAAYHGRILS